MPTQKAAVWGLISPKPKEDKKFVPTIVREAKQVACGNHFFVILGKDDLVYTFGMGKGGRLGHGNEEDVAAPKVVQGLKDVAFVAAGGWHACAITKQGHVYVWGKCQQEFMVPTKLPLAQAATFASCGQQFMAILTGT